MATTKSREETLEEKGIRDEIEKRTGKTPQQLYQEREKRLMDTVELKQADRVPVMLNLGHFPIKYAGLPISAQYYDPAALRQAFIKTLLDFEADACQPLNIRAGFATQILGAKQYILPTSDQPDLDIQFVDMDIMKENEYDLFIADPGDFMLRQYLPRAFESLAPLSKLPLLQSLDAQAMTPASAHFSSPEVVQAFEALSKAGREQAKLAHAVEGMLDIFGLPQTYYPGGVAYPPFDLFVSFLRGLRGTLLDMFKRPDKLLAAMEKVLERRLLTMEAVDPRKRRVGAGGNHFQSEEFLSRKQFETFPWPTWKKALMATIDRGLIPRAFMEGKNDDRIDFFLELPKGKAVIVFEKIDMPRAKEILGGHLCIGGGVPLALLWGGTPQEVDEYCRDLIKVCGKGGGFILAGSGGLSDSKPANLKAMIDSAKKYGRY
ncbi:MAG: hypothetical protein HYX85_01710 [Chloroflexi bacterium]|nr:hypothetical protein [Chloroflexota bacterium]